MSGPLSPSQALYQIEKLAMTPLSAPRDDQAAREQEFFERRRQIADLAADLRLKLERQGIS